MTPEERREMCRERAELVNRKFAGGLTRRERRRLRVLTRRVDRSQYAEMRPVLDALDAGADSLLRVAEDWMGKAAHFMIGAESVGFLLREAQIAFNRLSEAERAHHRDEQAVSFVYGSLKLHNPSVTREQVRAALARLRAERAKGEA